jgi:hypothetical protein
MRFSALLACLLPLALAGCGDSDPKTATVPEDEPAEGSPADGSPADGADPMTSDGNELINDVLLTLDEKEEHQVLGGGARLDVKELRKVVLLTVTTVYPNNHDDLVLLQLELDGVENAMGQHTENLADTQDTVAIAQAYIDQVSYTSQSGTIDVTLSNVGKIEGHFAAQLTPDEEGSAAEPREMSGYFAGKWSLLCSSPVLNLPGDHSISNSAYCRNLTF